jgi:hypothetical protein
LTGLPGLLGSGSLSRPLGIVVIGVDMICSSGFVFVEAFVGEVFRDCKRRGDSKNRGEEGSAIVVKGS